MRACVRAGSHTDGNANSKKGGSPRALRVHTALTKGDSFEEKGQIQERSCEPLGINHRKVTTAGKARKMRVDW